MSACISSGVGGWRLPEISAASQAVWTVMRVGGEKLTDRLMKAMLGTFAGIICLQHAVPMGLQDAS